MAKKITIKKADHWKSVCAFHKMSEAIPDVSAWPEHMRNYAIAAYKLPFIVEAENKGWIPDYTDSSQIKYEPVFKIIADKKNKSGAGLSLLDCDSWRTRSLVGPRLVFRDWDTLKKCVEKHIDVYTDFYIIPR